MASIPGTLDVCCAIVPLCCTLNKYACTFLEVFTRLNMLPHVNKFKKNGSLAFSDAHCLLLPLVLQQPFYPPTYFIPTQWSEAVGTDTSGK